MGISRRTVVTGLAGIIAVPGVAAAESLAPTPQETLGPYFPVRTPAEHNYDLTRLPGRTAQAAGQIIELTGRVLGVDGSPILKAKIEIWQANAAGRYTNPIDRNAAPLDPNFKGVAVLHSAADGAYRIRTVKPGPYPDPAGGTRAPHIHFEVAAGDYLLATQMYFPGEALNDKDILMSTMSGRHRDPKRVICSQVEASEPGVLRFEWNIVLLQV
jgi:protocatechuate 3,4-dioxygenase beta subunit